MGKTKPGYTMTVRKNGSITFKSRGRFDLRNVPILNELGLPPPPKEEAPDAEPKQD